MKLSIRDLRKNCQKPVNKKSQKWAAAADSTTTWAFLTAILQQHQMEQDWKKIARRWTSVSVWRTKRRRKARLLWRCNKKVLWDNRQSGAITITRSSGGCCSLFTKGPTGTVATPGRNGQGLSEDNQSRWRGDFWFYTLILCLYFLLEDINRQGLLKTPIRAAKAMLYFTKGYEENFDGKLLFEFLQLIKIRCLEWSCFWWGYGRNGTWRIIPHDNLQ